MLRKQAPNTMAAVQRADENAAVDQAVCRQTVQRVSRAKWVWSETTC